MADKLALRVNAANPNHHLWCNNGTWWLHYTIHRPDYTKERVRLSLRTRLSEQARAARDRIIFGQAILAR